LYRVVICTYIFFCCFGRILVQKKLQAAIKTGSASRLVGHKHSMCSMTSLQRQWSASAPVCAPSHGRKVRQVKGGSIARVLRDCTVDIGHARLHTINTSLLSTCGRSFSLAFARQPSLYCSVHHIAFLVYSSCRSTSLLFNGTQLVTPSVHQVKHHVVGCC